MNMAAYQVENQWGGPSAPWNTGSTWILGNRENQHLVAIDIESNDNGRTFTGTVTYNGEGLIAFEATLKTGNMYNARVRWGGSTTPWHEEGVWIIGGRRVQHCVQLQVTSNTVGNILTGTMTYEGEGPIGFRGTYLPSYEIQFLWGGCEARWNEGGIWVLSGRTNQRVVAMNIVSYDCGYSFEGTMTYENEGPIGFRAVYLIGNNYEVYNQWGGRTEPWHRSGDLIIGARDFHRVNRLQFKSNDSGENLFGKVAYCGGAAVGFKANLIHQIQEV